MNNYYGGSWAEDAQPSKVLPGAVVNAFMQRVYAIMAIGLAITGVVAWSFFNATFAEIGGELAIREGMEWVLGPARWVIMLLPLAFVLFLSFGSARMGATTATVVFGLYTASMGLSLSFIFAIYSLGSIAITFFITAGTFAAMSVYGMVTKADLTKLGSILMMALFGIIIATVVNLFVGSSTLQLIISIIGVLVFTGLTAYDTQKIMRTSLSMEAGTEEAKKAAVFGALTLYLDFINLFLMLLRLFGGRRD